MLIVTPIAHLTLGASGPRGHAVLEVIKTAPGDTRSVHDRRVVVPLTPAQALDVARQLILIATAGISE